MAQPYIGTVAGGVGGMEEGIGRDAGPVVQQDRRRCKTLGCVGEEAARGRCENVTRKHIKETAGLFTQQARSRSKAWHQWQGQTNRRSPACMWVGVGRHWDQRHNSTKKLPAHELVDHTNSSSPAPCVQAHKARDLQQGPNQATTNNRHQLHQLRSSRVCVHVEALAAPQTLCHEPQKCWETF
jgi:hypothetical protein